MHVVALVSSAGGLKATAQVLAAPPGCHTLFTPDGRVSLIVSGAFPPSRPSADLLLTTLAMAVGPRAIAVVLSGSGHDAATGATAVYKHGGVVITTDKETSAHFSMPAATIARDEIVDAVVTVPELGARLVQLVTAPRLDG
ncbi:chemotaxis protein CheB [Nocardioides sp. GXQ0305]|uniref:chemotaxis protein CheB n=1 Tax=Nocardioides sp. GXQ0305 TaxID=3423912 RepID=UPI003D7D1FC6